MNTQSSACPCCGAHNLTLFYEARDVPVQSMLLLESRAEALAFPRGDLALAFCATCGFITNTAFDPATQEFSARYEASQSFSATFTSFHQRLAGQVIERYNLRGKQVIEIGCGQGEFLALLCELGDNHGLGFDPVYNPERAPGDVGGRMQIIADFYSEQYAGHYGDLICCKMTLEHIHNPVELVTMVRRAIGERDTVVFFQIPNTMPVLHEVAFWDIYYEHCSYFTPGSLARLFRRCGFLVSDLWTDYDDQYLMIEARVNGSAPATTLPHEEPPEALAHDVATFTMRCREAQMRWRERLDNWRRDKKQIVLWGAGSKGVAFLTSLEIGEEVARAVDINPHKQGKYMAVTGQPIVGPADLRETPPDVVLVMNPVYKEEIRRTLAELGLAPELVAVGE